MTAVGTNGGEGAVSEQRTVVLELDEDDYRSLQQAFARRQAFRVLPEGGGNLAGRLAAEICRGWLEMLEHRPRGDA